MRQIDIAKKLNIAVSTVSRVLNNVPKSASPELSRQIWALAHDSNYAFNPDAQSLKKAKRPGNKDSAENKILCLYARSPISAIASFFDNIARGFEVEAMKLAYSIVAKESIFNLSAQDFLRQYGDLQAYPILVLGRIPQNLLNFFDRAKTPVVQAGINVNNLAIDRVLCNGYHAAEQIVQYLFFCGHRHIAYLGETQNEMRYFGFRSQISSLGLPFSEQAVIECELSEVGGYNACERFLERRKSGYFCSSVSAVFCANDETAVGAYKKFREAGLRIPEDISVIGMDDIEQAQDLSPMLTTMKIPQFEIGQIAAQTLTSRINGRHNLPLKIELPFQMVIRNSVHDFHNHSLQETKRALYINFLQ